MKLFKFKKREQIYILPTNSGFIYLISSFLMIMVGSAFENNMVNVLAFFVLSLVLISMVQTHHLLRGLEVIDVQVSSGFAGESFQATISARDLHASGKKSFQARPGVHLRLKKKSLEGWKSDLHQTEFPVQTTAYLAPPRGIYQGQDIVIETRAPLGLFRAWSPRKFKYSYIIFPRPQSFQDTEPSIAANYSSAYQNKTESNSEGAEDFRELRDYRRGDNISRMDWKVQARTGKLMTKTFYPQESPYRILSDSDFVSWSKEKMLSQLCHWALQEYRRQRPFALCLKGQLIGPGEGTAFLNQALEFLGRYE